MNEWEWQALEDRTPVDALQIEGREVRAGQRVRLRPRAGGDVLDIALIDKIALVTAIEQDYDGKIHLAVVLDDDPGKDLGMLRQPGHQFFFSPDEVEPCEMSEADVRPEPVEGRTNTPILIAGIGNIFLGDDGFGVEVIRRLHERAWPEDVKVMDYGIRGLDLTYALVDARGPVILVDTCPRGDAAGTLFVVAPTVDDEGGSPDGPGVEAHSMNPVAVLRTVKAMGGDPSRVLLVGCEPETFGPEEGAWGLSAPVAAAVDPAVELIESLVKDLRDGRWPGDRTPTTA